MTQGRDSRGRFAGGGGGGSAKGKLKVGKDLSRLVVGGSPRGTVAGTKGGRAANAQRALASTRSVPKGPVKGWKIPNSNAVRVKSPSAKIRAEGRAQSRANLTKARIIGARDSSRRVRDN